MITHEATRLALLRALDEAIELALEGWEYASDYMHEKWMFSERITELQKTLKEFDNR
jgi:hypothetical protein